MTGRGFGRTAVATVAVVGVVVFAFVHAPVWAIAAAGVVATGLLVTVTRERGVGLGESLRGPMPGALVATLAAVVAAGLPGHVGWLPVLAPIAVVAVYALAVWSYP